MNAFSHEALKDDPKFKAFCARRINGKVTKPKRFKVPIPKPKSIWSVLGEYTTGRMVKITPTKKRELYSPDKEPDWIDVEESEREDLSYTREEKAKIIKVTRDEFTSEIDSAIAWPESEPIIETLAQGPFEWPPQDWSPIIPKPVERGEGRWLKSLFVGKCVDCAVAIEKDQKALWFKEKRALLCESCGKRSQKARYAA